MAALASFAIFLGASLAAARHSPISGAPAGDFEEWVLAMEWQPQWSLMDCKESGRNGVGEHLVPGSFATTHPSLHGLWPEYDMDKHSGHSWPQFCKGPQGDFTICERNIDDPVCQVDPRVVAEYNTTALWQKFALEYSWANLLVHEWSKHGSCTGWTEEQRFDVTTKTYQRALQMPGPQFISANAGGTVTYQALTGAFDKDVELNCHQCSLADIYMAFDAERGTLLPGRQIDYPNARSTCEECEQIRILAWHGCPRENSSFLV